MTLVTGAVTGAGTGAVTGADRPNFLLITADDLNCDSVGVYGSAVKGTTPNIDRLASQGMRFERAHVTIAVCQPCRNVWLTGRYPHRSGGEGFHKLQKPDVPTLPGILRDAGYLVGILGKLGHSTSYASFRWDTPDTVPLGGGRSPRLYREHAQKFFEQAKSDKKPFFLMANSHDPHRPFHGNDGRNAGKRRGAETPSRVFEPGEIVVPAFLPDIPPVRREISEYYSSVRRCDDTVGAVLRALETVGLADSTIVMFLADHGMALPFSKTNVYHHSTRTPWIVRWPGHVRPGTVDSEHFVSGIDLTPTVLDLVGVAAPEGIDGRTFRPVLSGKKQTGRDMVFTQFHQTSARRRYPMRAVEERRFRYIYNAWADGERVFRNESQAGRSWKAMVAASQSDAAIAARCELFSHRVLEELYDVQKDPDCLRNLIDDPEYAAEAKRCRALLADWMKRTDDAALKAFENRDDEEVRRRFLAEEDARAGERKKRAKARARK